MSIPDLWSLVTGIASILGLLITLPKEFSAWRKYTIPITCIFAGIAIGRMSVNFSQSIDAIFRDPYLVVTLLVIVMVIASTGLLIVFMENRKYVFNPFFFFLLVLGIFIPYMFQTYFMISPGIPTQDYLVLARLKEQTGELGDAISYYQKYLQYSIDDIELDNEMKIEKKISTLQSKQLDGN